MNNPKLLNEIKNVIEKNTIHGKKYNSFIKYNKILYINNNYLFESYR